MTQEHSHRNRTLLLCAILHGFTHIYNVALIPLYLLIRKDLNLADDSQTTLLVTVMGIAYCVPSYPMGILSDRMNRKFLLGIGLLINGIAFILMSLAHSYSMLLAAGILAGLGGSIFHPCATALVARLFPEGRGKALGRMGIGAGVGFFIAPIYAGWRGAMAGWRQPTLELGILGVIASLLFFWLADDQPVSPIPSSGKRSFKLFNSTSACLLFLGAALIFSLRDFAGGAMPSMGSLFLQHAHGLTPDKTGFALSCIFIASTISNPLFGHWSDRGRIPRTASVLVIAAICIACFPWVPPQWSCLAFALYGFFFMATYPMVEAGLMESVSDSVRGQIYGLFLMAGGIVGNLGHWFAGKWVHSMGADASNYRNYGQVYVILAMLVLLSIGGLACLRALKKKEPQSLPNAKPEVA